VLRLLLLLLLLDELLVLIGCWPIHCLVASPLLTSLRQTADLLQSSIFHSVGITSQSQLAGAGCALRASMTHQLRYVTLCTPD
jgi:hypothetical protein